MGAGNSMSRILLLPLKGLVGQVGRRQLSSFGTPSTLFRHRCAQGSHVLGLYGTGDPPDFAISQSRAVEKAEYTHLVTIGDFVLAVEVVPDVNNAVHPCHEENACPRGAKAPAR